MSGDFFGGIFYFNRDGRTDLSEQFLAFMMMQETLGEDDDQHKLDDSIEEKGDE